jgi:hypothetical protein
MTYLTGSPLNIGNNSVFDIPELLSGVMYRNTNGLTLVLQHKTYEVGRTSIPAILTAGDSRYSKDDFGYAIISNNQILIKGVANILFGDVNNMVLRAVLADQRDVLPSGSTFLQQELKVASDAKLQLLIAKNITSMIGDKDGNKDNNKSDAE